MKDPKKLYQEVIMTHYRQPVGLGLLDPAAYRANGSNPRCGDQIEVSLRESEDGLELGMEPQACAIATASASIMVSSLQGLDKEKAQALIARALQWFESKGNSEAPTEELASIRHLFDYPSRIACACLPWNAAKAALAGESSFELKA